MKCVLGTIALLVTLNLYADSPLFANETCDQSVDQEEIVDFGKREYKKQILRMNKVEPVTPLISPTNVRHFRIRLMVEHLEVRGWTIVIYDNNFKVVQTISQDDFGKVKHLWTSRILGGWGYINVIAKGDQDPKVGIDSIISMPKTSRRPFYSTQQPGVQA